MNLDEKIGNQGGILGQLKSFLKMTSEQRKQSSRRLKTHGLAVENFDDSDMHVLSDTHKKGMIDKMGKMSTDDLASAYFEFATAFSDARKDKPHSFGIVLRKIGTHHQLSPYGASFTINALKEELKKRGVTDENFAELDRVLSEG